MVRVGRELKDAPVPALPWPCQAAPSAVQPGRGTAREPGQLLGSRAGCGGEAGRTRGFAFAIKGSAVLTARPGPAPLPPSARSDTNPTALTAGAPSPRPSAGCSRPAAGDSGAERRAALSPPALRLQQPARLPELRLGPAGTSPPCSRPGPRLPRRGPRSPAAAACARGEGPAAASSSPALRDGGRRPGPPLPGAAPAAPPEAVPEASGPRVEPGCTARAADGGLQLSGCHFKSLNNCKDWIS